MNGQTHEAIVRNAYGFIVMAGTADEKHALNDLIAKYTFEIGNLQRGSSQVDHYQDLALYTDYCDCDIGNIVYAGATGSGNPVAPLNHFVNAFGVQTSWRSAAKGYCTLNTPPTSDNDQKFAGYVGDYEVHVDYDDSASVARARRWWRDIPHWADNWNRVASGTEFIPASILAGYYYRHLLLNHDFRLQVSKVGNQVQEGTCDVDVTPTGENIWIEGISYLAPVLHMIADACVPHHVRGVLGCEHQSWENTVDEYSKSDRLYNPTLVRSLITSLSSMNPYKIDGTNLDFAVLGGKFCAETFTYYVARTTIHRIMVSTGVGLVGDHMDRSILAAQPAEWWTNYVANSNPGPNALAGTDYEYMYNLAVAASVLVLCRAYEDLVAVGIVHGSPRPSVPPVLALDKIPGLAKPAIHLEAPMQVRDAHLSAGLQEVLKRLEQAVTLSADTDLDANTAARELQTSEEYLVQRFLKGMEVHGPRFCPLAVNLSSVFPGMRPLWGFATYRPPTAAELKDKILYRKYVDGESRHSWKASLYAMTYYLACARYELARAKKLNRPAKPRLADVIQRLTQQRKQSLEAKKFVPLKPLPNLVPLQVLMTKTAQQPG